MREEEKIQAGILFCPGDEELRAIKLRTHNLNVDYNATYEDEVEKRADILHKILGEMGEGCFFQGPIYFHYGRHTKVGKNLFANFNFTVQDDAEVTIGNDCNFGPNVTIVTPMHPMLAQERNDRRGGGQAPVLCQTRDHRRQLLVWGPGDGLPRRPDRGQLRHWRGQRGDAGYPVQYLCGRRPLPGHPGTDGG